MLRQSLAVGLFLVLAATLTFVGCSDDNPTNSTVGDPNAPAFQPLKAAIAQAVDSTLAMSLKFAYKPNRYPSDIDWEWPALGPNDSLLYNYVGDWHVLYLGLSTAFDYSYVYVDSARFWEGTTAVQYFRSPYITGLDLIRHQTYTYTGSGDDYTNISSSLDLSFRDLQDPTRYFYGDAQVTIDDYYVEGGSQKTARYEFTANADDITYSVDHANPWYDSYPTGGTLTLTAAVERDDASVEWDITIEFQSNGAAQVSATDGHLTYSYTFTPEYN